MTGFFVLQPRRRLVVPHELSERMISHLRADTKSLTSCALVCRSWAEACRCCLFKKLTLHPDIATRFFGLVCSIDLHRGTPSPVPPVATYCRALHIREIVIHNSNCSLVGNLLALHCHPLRPLFSTITALILTDSRFLSIERFMVFISCFSNLHSLSLDNIQWTNDPGGTQILDSAMKLSSITSLTLRNLDWQQFFAFINQAQMLQGATRLEIGPIGEWDAHHVVRYIFGISSNLEYLSIRFCSKGDSEMAPIVAELPKDLQDISRRSFRVHQVTNHPLPPNCVRDEYRRIWGLESSICLLPHLTAARIEDFVNVHLHKNAIQPNACFWAPRLLTAMVPPNLQCIVLGLTLECAGQLDQYEINWEFLDLVVNSEDYMSLKRLVFSVEGIVDVDNLQDLISSRLPLLTQRGILEFCIEGSFSFVAR